LITAFSFGQLKMVAQSNESFFLYFKGGFLSLPPSIEQIKTQARNLQGRIVNTPVHRWSGIAKDQILAPDIDLHFKLELFQHTGTFKLRGALSIIDQLNHDKLSRGVVAATGGNHGIAVAHAAKSVGTTAKIVVPKTINSFRRRMLECYGAEIIDIDSITEVFSRMKQIAEREGRSIVHPFDHPAITLGTGTLGLEVISQVPDVDVVIVPIGGGGLASGVACAVKQAKPNCLVFGVEPELANSMRLSLDAGRPVSVPGGPKSIADSLGAPHSEAYSFSICQQFLDDVVLVNDQQLSESMLVLCEHLKLAVEPAGAAATAALLGPLKQRCIGKRVCVIISGSNIDLKTFSRQTMTLAPTENRKDQIN
jgi:threonine dehydratase